MTQKSIKLISTIATVIALAPSIAYAEPYRAKPWQTKAPIATTTVCEWKIALPPRRECKKKYIYDVGNTRRVNRKRLPDMPKSVCLSRKLLDSRYQWSNDMCHIAK